MSLITVERKSGVVTLTLANPPLNILTCQVMTDLMGALREVRSTDRAVVLRGAGKHFSAGADIGEHLPDKCSAMLVTLGVLFNTLHDVPVPTVAVVRGACMGAGLELAAACDLMVASEDSRLGVPEISLGVIAPIAAVDLPRKIGAARAAELLYFGKTISGRQAGDWGLANEVAPESELDARAEAFTSKLGLHSGAALRSCKRALRDASSSPIHPHAVAATLRAYSEGVLPSTDGHEGLQAFLEKRKPAWQDK